MQETLTELTAKEMKVRDRARRYEAAQGSKIATENAMKSCSKRATDLAKNVVLLNQIIELTKKLDEDLDANGKQVRVVILETAGLAQVSAKYRMDRALDDSKNAKAAFQKAEAEMLELS
jgi:hypothetical protein